MARSQRNKNIRTRKALKGAGFEWEHRVMGGKGHNKSAGKTPKRKKK